MVMTIGQLKEKIEPILRDNDVSYCAVFGSFARGDFNDKSDADLLIRFSKPKGLFEFFGLQDKLEKTVGRKVDLVTERALHPLLKENILKDLRVIYE
jgi:hypothetical protein